MKKEAVALSLALALAVGSAACRRAAEEQAGAEEDTLGVSVSPETRRELEEAGERVREAAREAGGAVGRALEETGEAVRTVGERVQEKAEKADTTGR